MFAVAPTPPPVEAPAKEEKKQVDLDFLDQLGSSSPQKEEKKEPDNFLSEFLPPETSTDQAQEVTRNSDGERPLNAEETKEEKLPEPEVKTASDKGDDFAAAYKTVDVPLRIKTDDLIPEQPKQNSKPPSGRLTPPSQLSGMGSKQSSRIDHINETGSVQMSNEQERFAPFEQPAVSSSARRP